MSANNENTASNLKETTESKTTSISWCATIPQQLNGRLNGFNIFREYPSRFQAAKLESVEKSLYDDSANEGESVGWRSCIKKIQDTVDDTTSVRLDKVPTAHDGPEGSYRIHASGIPRQRWKKGDQSSIPPPSETLRARVMPSTEHSHQALERADQHKTKLRDTLPGAGDADEVKARAKWCDEWEGWIDAVEAMFRTQAEKGGSVVIDRLRKFGWPGEGRPSGSMTYLPSELKISLYIPGPLNQDLSTASMDVTE